MKIINQTKNIVLAEEVMVADTLFSRIKGLLGKKEFKPGEALVIEPCKAIHTFFMRFPIDILFVDKNNRVIAALSSVRPFHLSRVYFAASLVIELPVGTATSNATQKGDTLSFF